MYLSAIGRFSRPGLSFLSAPLVAALLVVAPSTGARADSAYVPQMPRGAIVDVPLTKVVQRLQQPQSLQQVTRQSAGSLPEVAVLHGHNVVQTGQIGSYNTTLQLQSGANNSSNVGIIGAYNNVAVLQSGNSLRSNVVLLNTLGMNIGVLQPKGSAPVNVLIARLPGGGLLIKR